MSRSLLGATLTAVALTGHAVRNLRHVRVAPTTAGAVSTGGGNVDRTVGSTADRSPRVSVLIPARDEAARIAPCVRAVLDGLTGVDAEVLVLDDGSMDGTAEVVRAAADGDPRLRVLTGRALPPGWLGKPHACHQLAEAAAGEVLVFLDADVRLAPGGVARTVALLGEAPLELVSPYPRQEAEGVLPRLVQPLLQWSWLTFLPLGLAERSGRESLTAANGQLLACDAAAYRVAGGHAAVRGEVVEDVALARAFKRHGLRATVADGTDIATCRMYDSGAALVEGYSKSLGAAFGSPAAAAAVMAFLAWVYLLPPVALWRGLRRRRFGRAALGAVGYGAAVIGRVVAARRFGGRLADTPAHPLSIVALLWLTWQSWQQRRAGTATWKGRAVLDRG